MRSLNWTGEDTLGERQRDTACLAEEETADLAEHLPAIPCGRDLTDEVGRQESCKEGSHGA